MVRHGKKITGATKNKLKIVKALVGRRLTVRVTATAQGYNPVEVQSRKSAKSRASGDPALVHVTTSTPQR